MKGRCNTSGENVKAEVEYQTPVITQIAENLGVTITTPSGTNKQILQGNNANLLNIKNNAKKEGLYVWKKLTAQDGDFLDYVVDNNESKYPDGGTQDGYWYEKVVEGVAGIDFGEVTLASTTTSVTVNHSLGVVPSFAAFISNNFDVSTSKSETFMNVNGHVLYTHNMVVGNVNHKTADVELTETTISFGTSSSNLPFAATTYYWIAIA